MPSFVFYSLFILRAAAAPLLLLRALYLRQKSLRLVGFLRVREQFDHLLVNFFRLLIFAHTVVGVRQIEKCLPVGGVILKRFFQIRNSVLIISRPESLVIMR